MSRARPTTGDSREVTQRKAVRRSSPIVALDRQGEEKTGKPASPRPIVVVLGMHRSGTSLCSHLLSVLGVDMADKLAGPGSEVISPDNARGYWERWEIVGFHDRILAHLNRGYFSPFHDLPLPAGWWADPDVAAIRREIVGFLEKRMGETRFGFKDPRTIRLLPLWQRIFDDLNLAPRFVLCLRNPAEVARSLAAREQHDPDMGEYRWVIHMIDFFRYIGSSKYCTVEYEKWFDDPWMNITKLQNFLCLDLQQNRDELNLALSEIIDPTLRHDRGPRSKAHLVLARSLYELAARGEDDPLAREGIDQITTQFRDFQQFDMPFQDAFVRTSMALEAERQALAALAEREAGVRAQQDAAIEALQGELTVARAAVTEADHRRVRDSASMEAEIAGLRRDVEERVSAAAVMQTELKSVRDERTRLETQIDGLRRNVVSLRQEAEERAAIAASLRDELAASRQVGRSLLAAVRTGSLQEPAAADQPIG
jgi:hypothetical protein